MPVLSIYIGNTNISVLHYSSEKDYRFFNFKYAYSPYIYGHLVTRDVFYERVLTQILKSIKINPNKCDVILSSYPSEIDILGSKKFIHLVEALESFGHQPYFFMDESIFLTQGMSGSAVSSAGLITEKDMGTDIDRKWEELDYLSNISLYPFVKAQTSGEQATRDKILRKSYHGAPIRNDTPTIFTGDRFVNLGGNYGMAYLLILDLITHPGIFEIKMDNGNQLATLGMLNLYDNSAYASIDNDFHSLGSVLKSFGDVEVLFETSVGTSQVFDVKAGEIFSIPLEPSMQARVLAKGNNVGQVEKRISGGEFGFLVDTRSVEIALDEYNDKNVKILQRLVNSRTVGL